MILVIIFINIGTSYAQNKTYKVVTIAFYNVENLFDTIDDSTKNDEASPIMEMSKKIRGEVYWEKQNKLAKVIKRIGTEIAKNAPAIVGLAEVENFNVLQDLVNTPELKEYNYGIIHYESPDYRGIDVALLYQKAIFKPLHSSPKELVIHHKSNDKRYHTRDQLYVKGLLDGDKFHFLVNHWPSRGNKEAYRIKAAKTARAIMDSVMATESDTKFMIMGDFNDGPHDKSITQYLNAKSTRKEVSRNDVYNPYHKIIKRGIGTSAWRDTWNLFDQIMLSKALINNDYTSYRMYKAGIFNPQFLQTTEGRYKGYPFRSFDDGGFTGGYSDHFPVYIHLIKETEN
ncbi:MAG: endonuclease/exonuclease/phosphatase family protein [Psychroflexus sp.]|nr:endonuclease/exonuclease/phosphatase family protein [Psychroflexus sp.]